MSSDDLRWSRWADAELRAEDARAEAPANAGAPRTEEEAAAESHDAPLPSVTPVTAQRVPDDRKPDPETSERFRKLARKSHEARRAKKEQKERASGWTKDRRKATWDRSLDWIYEEMEKDPSLLGNLALQDKALFSRLLAEHTQQKEQPQTIVMVSAFGVVEAERWVRLIDAGKVEQVRAELQAEVDGKPLPLWERNRLDAEADA